MQSVQSITRVSVILSDLTLNGTEMFSTMNLCLRSVGIRTTTGFVAIWLVRLRLRALLRVETIAENTCKENANEYLMGTLAVIMLVFMLCN